MRWQIGLPKKSGWYIFAETDGGTEMVTYPRVGKYSSKRREITHYNYDGTNSVIDYDTIYTTLGSWRFIGPIPFKISD